MTSNSPPTPISVNMLAPGEIFGGAERQLLTLARGLIEAGAHITADVFFDRMLASEMRQLGIKVTVNGKTPGRSSTRPVVQHSHGPRGTAFAWLHRLAPLVRTEHGLDYAAPDASLKQRLIRRIEESMLVAKTATSVLVSEELLGHRSSRMQPLPYRIIRNGADVPSKSSLSRPSEMAADRFNIVFAGRLETVKQPLAAISAVLALPSDSSARLLVLGDGPLLDSAHRLVDSHQSNARIEFCGFRTDSLNFIAHADAVLMPSLHEGLPYTAIESLGLRTPLIASAVGGLKELLTDRKHALLVPPSDITALSHAIRHLEQDPALRNRLVHEGQALYESALTSKAMVAGYMQLYKDLLTNLSVR